MCNTTNIITVDGPSGAGKGTLTQLLAEYFDWNILDSGALYRILGVASQLEGIDLTVDELSNESGEKITLTARSLDVDFKVNQQSKQVEPFLNGENLAKSIRTDDAGQAASKVAAIPAVRDALLARQKDFAIAPGLIADGRDMGTVVFKHAVIKIFLTASAECRAKRRYEQLIKQGVGANMRALLLSIQARDKRDQMRPVAPLVPAADAFIVDSSELNIEQVFEQVLEYIREKAPNFTSK
ncbi:MAG: (d)CMP kinase [Kangiellaceae bacterium]|nr:(d)CMP kinase [Kangiellaceae bacterium]